MVGSQSCDQNKVVSVMVARLVVRHNRLIDVYLRLVHHRAFTAVVLLTDNA